VVPNEVTDELFTRLKRHWTDDQIVEITGVIALFGFLNRFNDSIVTPLAFGSSCSMSGNFLIISACLSLSLTLASINSCLSNPLFSMTKRTCSPFFRSR